MIGSVRHHQWRACFPALHCLSVSFPRHVFPSDLSANNPCNTLLSGGFCDTVIGFFFCNSKLRVLEYFTLWRRVSFLCYGGFPVQNFASAREKSLNQAKHIQEAIVIRQGSSRAAAKAAPKQPGEARVERSGVGGLAWCGPARRPKLRACFLVFR